MTDRSFRILCSPGFLIGLSLLLTNDFVLKEQFHSGFTGKLSDFAGLFVFSLFWIAFFPRHKTFICVLTAALFVFWKSAYSQFLIDGWNSLPFFGIQRTVDYSDLWALVSVPLSFFYANVSFRVHVPLRFIHVIGIVSVVAFTATSFRQRAAYDIQFKFQSSRKQLLERMDRLPKNNVHDSFWKGETFEVTFDSCYHRAIIRLEERENPSVITLTEMENQCSGKASPEEMLEHFEKEFIDKIREDPVSTSAQVLFISTLPTSRPAASNTRSP